MAANPGEVTNLYSVTYNTNNSTGGVTPATQTAESNSGTYTFVAPMGEDLAKTGYGFAGWSENANATTVQYKPGSTITLSTASPTKVLYAVWQPSIKNATFMIDLTPAGCKASATGEAKQLKDTRDNKTYWTTKLNDGNCWMTQNLDYDDPGTPAANRFTKATGVSGWTSTDASYRAYYDSGNTMNGNHYSWAAATNNTGNSISSGNASGSICPEGWELPTSNNTNSGSFGALTASYGITSNATGSTTLRSAPLNFVYGGLVYSGSLQDTGTGYYWSSTAQSGANAYYLVFTSSTVDPSRNTNRYRGYFVRCLVQGS